MGSRLTHRGPSAMAWKPGNGLWFGNRFAAGEVRRRLHERLINVHGMIENRSEVAALCG